MKLEQKPSIRQHGFGKKRFQNFNKKTEEKTDLTKLPKATYSYSLICFIIIALLAVITVAAINLNPHIPPSPPLFQKLPTGAIRTARRLILRGTRRGGLNCRLRKAG